MALNIVAVAILAIMGAIVTVRSRRRTAQDVISDLGEDTFEECQKRGNRLEGKKGKKRFVLGDELSEAGLFYQTERSGFQLQQKLLPLFAAGLMIFVKAILCDSSLPGLIVSLGSGLAFGYLYSRRRLISRKERYIRDLEYFLPIVMERLVMGVQAGLDILAALTSVLDLDQPSDECSGLNTINRQSQDPVSRLLQLVICLTEAGMGFDESLHEVSESIRCSALKHAFIHLALSHKEGGELVTPLKELSDSTQLYFQETVEEEIAKLPVKATLPLVFIFAGLIVLFITSPLVQVIEIASSAGLSNSTMETSGR